MVRAEEEARRKREAEKAAFDQKIRQDYEHKAFAEAAEAKRAEKLVKALERKEREWIAKLQNAQKDQEVAFEQLEETLLHDGADDSQSLRSRNKK